MYSPLQLDARCAEAGHRSSLHTMAAAFLHLLDVAEHDFMPVLLKPYRSVDTRSRTLCVLASLAVHPSVAACAADLFMHNLHQVPVCLCDASKTTKGRTVAHRIFPASAVPCT
jgi:hypothetical protein